MSVAEEVLSKEEIQRYSRHLVLPEFGLEGQRKLKASRVLIVGAGGLGSPAGLYLAAAGIGTIGLADFDVVDLSNLQRQIIHTTSDVGRSKLQSAKESLLALNPHVNVKLHEGRLTSANAMDILRGYDIVVDGTDNFPTRYLVSDAAVLLGKPYVYGSIFRFDGQVSVFDATAGPCYRCLYPAPPPPGMVPSCAEGGVLGVLPGIIGSMQALEAIKLITAIGQPLIGRLLLFDALQMTARTLTLQKDLRCLLCGPAPTITELIDYEEFCGGGSSSPQHATSSSDITAEELKSRLDNGEKLFLLDVREPHEHDIANLGGYLIPLNQLPTRLGELDPSSEIIVHCKLGGRSAKAAEILLEHGFTRVRNLAGGIDRWAEKVDPAMPRY